MPRLYRKNSVTITAILSGMASRPTGERALIQQIRSRANRSSATVRIGIGDDCAVLRTPANSETVVTTDFTLEGRHFRREWHPARSVGHRCLARGLSDLAAMGAVPVAAFLSVAVPDGLDRRWLNGFFDGLIDLAQIVSAPLAGGDTAAAPGVEFLADIVLIGSVPRGRALLRSGAKPGDTIYVTGKLGGAAAELEALAHEPSTFARAKANNSHPHLFPQPRLKVGQQLVRRRLANAAIDVSDGISVDLLHLCEESGVDAVVQAEQLPLGGTLEQALHGGEDYELLFTSSKRLPARMAGVPITAIGAIEARKGRSARIDIVNAAGKRQRLRPLGWEHRL